MPVPFIADGLRSIIFGIIYGRHLKIKAQAKMRCMQVTNCLLSKIYPQKYRTPCKAGNLFRINLTNFERSSPNLAIFDQCLSFF
jgi:hypothetical protein